jgi:uncharacterized membrane protein YiaA
MQPSLPIPTDNIYKFSCLFGLALIISSIFYFVAAYNTSLDRTVKYFVIITSLEAKSEKTKTEEELLSMNKRLLTITVANEKLASESIGVIFVIGFCISFYGAMQWWRIIQKRDDQLAELQLEKLSIEIAKLKADLPESSPGSKSNPTNE